MASTNAPRSSAPPTPNQRDAAERAGPRGGSPRVRHSASVGIEPRHWDAPNTELTRNLGEGDDKVVVYRVYPTDAPPRKVRWLAKMTTDELVGQLELSNGFLRDLAHQMILWNGDKKAIEPLQKLVQKSLVPQARLHALCALDGLGELKEETLLTALGDEQASVRRHAIRLSEPFLGKSPKVATAVPTH